MNIERIDHLVLTVSDIPQTCAFYSQVLGMRVVTFNGDRTALSFGQSKINLHEAGNEWVPHAHHPIPGSADLCLITTLPITSVIDHLNQHGVAIAEGPVQRTGALGILTSVYIRDPDQNLIELSTYIVSS